jgi:hypothetical protein
MYQNLFSLDYANQNRQFWELLTIIRQFIKNEATHDNIT